MEIEEIKKLLFSNPDKLIDLLEKEGKDLDEVKKRLDLGREIVRKKYKMNEREIEAVEFCFWFSYFVERETRNMIIFPEVRAGARVEAMQAIIDRLTFGDKISLISDLYVKDSKKDKLVKMLWKINELRNAMAHGRFGELRYGKYHLSDLRGQLKILIDFTNSLLKKPKD